MNLDVLREKLCEFGLKPGEWSLDLLMQVGTLARIEVRSLTDRPFYFVGWATGAQWLTLTMRDEESAFQPA